MQKKLQMASLLQINESKIKGGRQNYLFKKAQLSTLSVKSLREEEGSFTSKRIKLDSGVNHVTSRTVRSHLNEDKKKGASLRQRSKIPGQVLQED